MKRSFFMQLISSADDRISSKRGAMVWFIFLFSFLIIYNLITGKVITQMYAEQLFEAMLLSMGLVFGEPFINLLTAVRGQKTTTSQTVIAPPDSQVINTTTTKEPEEKK